MRPQQKSISYKYTLVGRISCNIILGELMEWNSNEGFHPALRSGSFQLSVL